MPEIILPNTGSLSQSNEILFSRTRDKIKDYLSVYNLYCPQCQKKVRYEVLRVLHPNVSNNAFRVEAIGKKGCPVCEIVYLESGFEFKDNMIRVVPDSYYYKIASDFLQLVTKEYFKIITKRRFLEHEQTAQSD